MKTKTLQYTIDPKTWTDLRQKNEISFDEQGYLLNAIREPNEYFKNIYLQECLLQKIIKNALPESKKPILDKKIPISCQPFPENITDLPDKEKILLELDVPEDQVVTVDYQTWLYLANLVNQTIAKYDSKKDMNKILMLPDKELKIDRLTRVHLLNVLNPARTMNLIPKLKLSWVKKAYENADGKLSEIDDY